jgi:hypothetical protein
MAVRKACPNLIRFFTDSKRFLSSLGPRVSYPIPEGILGHHGTNEVLISLWALSACRLFFGFSLPLKLHNRLDATGARMSRLELNRRVTVVSSKLITVAIVPTPGWAKLRGNALQINLSQKRLIV